MLSLWEPRRAREGVVTKQGGSWGVLCRLPFLCWLHSRHLCPFLLTWTETIEAGVCWHFQSWRSPQPAITFDEVLRACSGRSPKPSPKLPISLNGVGGHSYQRAAWQWRARMAHPGVSSGLEKERSEEGPVKEVRVREREEIGEWRKGRWAHHAEAKP